MKFEIKEGGIGRAASRGRQRTWADLLPPHLQALQLQDDLSVANGPGATVRVDMNNQYQSLGTMNSGVAAPATTYSNLLWADTTNTLSKKRNNANGAWKTFANLDWTQWQLDDGSVGAPAYSFNLDPDSGMYRIGANNLGWSVNGVKGLELKTTGVVVGAGATNAQLQIGDASGNYGLSFWLSAASSGSGNKNWVIDVGNFAAGQLTFAQASAAGGVIGSAATAMTTLEATGRFTISYNLADYGLRVFPTNAAPYGIYVKYVSSPNNAGSSFYYFEDSAGGGTARNYGSSDGGIHNFTANNTNLSSLLEKNSFELFSSDALRQTVWDFGKRMSMAWGRFKYNDQTHNDWNSGYGAEYVKEAAGIDFPELVSLQNWGTAENPKMRLSVYDNDLMHLMGSITTQSQFRIDDHETRLAALESATLH